MHVVLIGFPFLPMISTDARKYFHEGLNHRVFIKCRLSLNHVILQHALQFALP